jgi:Uncharacterized protein conserved in bacteria
MLALGMLGAAAAENQVQGALQGQNNGQPIHIEAMTLEIRDKDKTATFSGNVQVVQGDTTMKMPNPCRVLRAGRRCGRYQGRRRPHVHREPSRPRHAARRKHPPGRSARRL